VAVGLVALVNGYSGFVPASYREMVVALRT
jgi:hypothetical protein